MTLTALIRTIVAAMILSIVTIGPGYANPDSWRLSGWADTDFSRTSIDLDDILSGGPPKDGIPAIDDPQFVDAGSAANLQPGEPVVTVKIGDDARAYPFGILIWHEIVNDVVGGRPVTITYCPLCNSAVVFDRRVAGRILDFGTTGKLLASNLVMYDRQTQSWWQQFTGQGIVGAMTGVELETIPVRVESFERFLAANPDGKVLVPNNPNMRRYGQNPYERYDGRARPYEFLFNAELPDYINPMARVVAYEFDGVDRAVTMELVRNEGSITLDGVTISWFEGQNSALDATIISQGRDVGNIVVQANTADGPVDLVYDVTFAFVFHAFYPDERIKQN
jgi:uncharacterized protein DUF3179